MYPTNVLHASPIAHNSGHSAPFPEWLPEFFIKLFTDPGDLVIDPFAGSGTTVRTAAKLGRTGIGIERLATAKERMAKPRQGLR